MVFAFGGRITRLEGALMLSAYIGYTWWLILRNG